MTPKVAGLDLSLRATGIAAPDGSLHTIKPGKLRGAERLVYLRERTMALVEGAELAAIEGYAFGAKGRAVFDVGELGGIVRVALHEHAIPYLVFSPAEVKKFATGMGNADKQTMIEAAIRAGARPANSDEADAYWIRLLAREMAD